MGVGGPWCVSVGVRGSWSCVWLGRVVVHGGDGCSVGGGVVVYCRARGGGSAVSVRVLVVVSGVVGGAVVVVSVVVGGSVVVVSVVDRGWVVVVYVVHLCRVGKGYVVIRGRVGVVTHRTMQYPGLIHLAMSQLSRLLSFYALSVLG